MLHLFLKPPKRTLPPFISNPCPSTGGEMREKFKQCHAQVFLAGSSDAFDRPNNPIGFLHSSSFHTSLYYLHEQLQLGVVVGYCRLYRERVFTYACRSLLAAIVLAAHFQPATFLLRASLGPRRGRRGHNLAFNAH